MTESDDTGPDDTGREDGDAVLERAVREGMPAAVADLARLVRIASVSWPSFDPAHVARSAEAVAELHRATGFFDDVGILRAPKPDGTGDGGPAVVARRRPAEGRPTVLLYAHHDVQPPGDESAWESPPFEPTVRGDRLYGRGAADDKAGVVAHVAAVRALREAYGRDPEIGITVFVEGEEEYGSPSFDAFLAAHREALAADAIVVADSANWDDRTPALTVSLRGNITLRLTVTTLDHPLHSGIYGGAVPDAMLAMTRLLASLHDDDGAVAVAGLRAHPLTAPPYGEDRFRTEAGLLDGVGTLGPEAPLTRIWAHPSITVTGIDAPSVDAASNTLAARMTARLSARIAPGQSGADAFRALEDHLRAHVPFGARLEIDQVEIGDPFVVDAAGPAATAMTAAMTRAWARDVVEAGMGGSIPFVPTLARAFPSAEILITGVEDPDTRAHSPNESLHLGVLRKAILTEALFLARLDRR